MTNINERNYMTSRGLNIPNLRGNSDGQDFDTRQNLDETVSYIVDAPFDLIERQKGDFTIFAPKGRVNNATIMFMKKRLYAAADETECKIILNLRFVKSIDSVGLGVLITAHKMAAQRGGMIVFTDMNERIFKTMKMLYMDRFLKMSPDMKGAVKLMDW